VPVAFGAGREEDEVDDDPRLHDGRGRARAAGDVLLDLQRRLNAEAGQRVGGALGDVVCYVARDFVVGLWYRFVSPGEDELPLEVRVMMTELFLQLVVRAKKVELGRELMEQVCGTLAECLTMYRGAVDSVGGERVLGKLDADEREEALRVALLESGAMHVALVDEANEGRYLRKVAEGIVTHLIPARDANCRPAKVMAREITACLVLKNALNFAKPEQVNAAIVNALKAKSEEASPAAVVPRRRQLTPSFAGEREAYGLRTPATSPRQQQQPGTPGSRMGSAVKERRGREDQSGLGALLLEAPEDSADPIINARDIDVQVGRRLTYSPLEESVARHAVDRISRSSSGSSARRGARGLHGAAALRVEIDGSGPSSYAVYVCEGRDEGEQWTVRRRFRNFELLHRRLRARLGARYASSLPPKRLTFFNLDAVVLESRRLLLDAYLGKLVGDKVTRRAPELLDFLDPESVDFSPDAPEFDGIMGSLTQSLGLSAGRSGAPSGTNPPSASRSHALVPLWRQQTPPASPRAGFTPRKGPMGLVTGGPSPARRRLGLGRSGSSDGGGSEAGGELQAVAKDVVGPSSGLAEPLHYLVDVVLRLSERPKWGLRRNVLRVVRELLSLLFGGSIDRGLAGALKALGTEDAIAPAVELVRDALWPGGGLCFLLDPSPRPPPPPPVSEAEARHALEGALRRIPIAVTTLVSSEYLEGGAWDVFNMLQSKTMMKQLAFGILEHGVAAIFPELAPTFVDTRPSA